MACLTDGHRLTVCLSEGKSRRVKRRTKWGWCFACRITTWFSLWGFFPSGYSYYAPNFWYQCDNCKKQGSDLFPGWERTWEE
jgi:hypothetical protein